MTATATIHAYPAAATTRNARNVIAVSSGKGGVGKTWFSITLATALARLDRRVLLLDGDIGLANVDIQLGLVPRRDLADVIAGRCLLGDAIESYVEGGFDVIAGKSGSGSLAELAPARLRLLRDTIVATTGRYDRAIIDLAAGVDAGVHALAGSGGPVVVLVNDEPTSLTDAYAMIKTTYRRDPQADIRIVINAAVAHTVGEKTYQGLRRVCESFLGRTPPLLGVIRRDAKVADAIRRQMPLAVRHPASEAAADVARIAERLAA